jgi:hypothetical protein
MKVRRVLLTERRKFDPASPNTAAIVAPNPVPEPNIDNSWLIYDDPKGRFHFTFPQELHVNSELADDNGVTLLEPPQTGRDVIELRLVPKTGNAQADRLAADPAQEKKQLENLWRDSGQKVVAGTSGWLNDAEWARLGRKVYRIEAAMIEEAAGGGRSNDRLYTDRYIVQFTRNEALKVWAMTNREPHVEFRDKAESVIKSFQFGSYANAGSLPDPANLAPATETSPEPDTLPDPSAAPPSVLDEPPPIDSSAPPEAPR